MIAGGLLDRKIIKEQRKKDAKLKRYSLVLDIIGKVASVLFAILIIFAVVFCVYSKATEKKSVKTIPSLKVVESGSMAVKYEKNEYLFKYNIGDQIQKFDLIVLHELPSERDLKLFDIVAYESDGYLIIHRIVGIVEPDETHSERQFLLQGDANVYPDKFPVRYSQMRGIYRGKRIKYIGSFVLFMQSPAGFVCYGTIIFTVAAYPILAKIMNSACDKRLNEIEESDYD